VREPANAIDAPRRWWSSPLVALSLGALVVLLLAGFVILSVISRGHGADVAAEAGIGLTFGAVGLLLTLRQRQNPIGWLMLGTAVTILVNIDARVLAVHIYHPGVEGQPLARTAIFVVGALWAVPILLGTPTLLLFPDGRLPSDRWRWVLRTFVAVGAAMLVGQCIGAAAVVGRLDLKIDGTGESTTDPRGIASVVGWASAVLMLALIPMWFAWIIRLVRSYRRANGVRRQQLMWVSTGASLCIIGLIGELTFTGSGTGQVIVHTVGTLMACALPISMGIAILRYRLYEINRLVSRTVSYATVSAIVVAAYLVLITTATRVLGFSSPIGVAASTLVAVVLFNPLRRRLQHVVDRRFNRARYDADAMVAAFVSRLRGTVDLDAVEPELLATVQLAFEPTHVGIWVGAAIQS
jgi:hypothetical protein